MLVFNPQKVAGFFIRKYTTGPVSAIADAGKIPTSPKQDNMLVNLPHTDIAIPFGFNPTGAITSISRLEDGERVHDLIQWGIGDVPLSILEGRSKTEKGTVLREPVHIERYQKKLGFTDGKFSKSIAARVASTILEKLSDSDAQTLEANRPEATFYNDEYADFREIKTGSNHYNIEIAEESIEAINNTINVLLEILPSSITDGFISKLVLAAAGEKDGVRKETYEKYIKEVKNKAVSFKTSDFSVEFKPATFAALENVPDVPRNSFERYQKAIANELKELKGSFVKTEVAGSLGMYSLAMGAVGINSTTYFENVTFAKNQELQNTQDGAIPKVDRAIIGLQFRLRDAHKIISTLDKSEEIERVENAMLHEKEKLVEIMGAEATKELTLDVMKQKERFKYPKVISKIAYAYQKKEGLDLNTAILESNKDIEKPLGLGEGARLPYHAAKMLERSPHNTAVEAVTRSTLFVDKSEGKDELKEGQTISLTKVLSKNFVRGMVVKQKFHERLATSVQLLSTLTAKGYKQAVVGDDGKISTEIKNNTKERVEVMIAILDSISPNMNKTTLAAANSMMTDLKKALLKDGAKLNTAIKEILKDKGASYAPIISAAKNTNIKALYGANRDAKFINKHKSEMDLMTENIFNKMSDGTIMEDTEAISVAASGDEKRDYTNAKIAIEVFKKVITMFHLHTKTEETLSKEGAKVVGAVKAEALSDNALMYKSKEGSMLSAVIGVAKAATQGENEAFQPFFVPSVHTNTTAEVEKSKEVTLKTTAGEKTKTVKYKSLQLKRTPSLNVILGKMKSVSVAHQEEITPVLDKIISSKIKASAPLIKSAIANIFSEASEAEVEKVGHEVIEKAAMSAITETVAEEEKTEIVKEIATEHIEQAEDEVISREEAEAEAQKSIDAAEVEIAELIEEGENFSLEEELEFSPDLIDDLLKLDDATLEMGGSYEEEEDLILSIPNIAR